MCRGVTTWNLENEFTVTPLLAPNDSVSVTFTCTTPKCYGYQGKLSGCGTILNFFGQDAINIHFNAWKNDSRPGTTPVQLRYDLNGSIGVGRSYLSEVTGHGATQTYELGNINAFPRCTLLYDDSGRNTFTFKNLSEYTIQLDHVKLYRIYKMCKPPVDYDGMCTFAASLQCYAGASQPTTSGFDATRIDKPCNCTDGGGLSTTHYQDSRKAGYSISPGSSVSWTFNFGTLPYNPHRNYVDKSICLINFNNVFASSGSTSDITLDAYLNGTLINTYYLSGLRTGPELPLAPSHNLAVEDGNYQDTMANIITLVNSSPVTIEMGQGGGDGIDIYRIYESEDITPCCGECQVSCQDCQTGCEVSCQTGCEICESCYACVTCIACYSCYIACQEACQIVCQDCQTGCEISCETGCEVSCQTGCEVSCQTGCEVSCQTGCEVSCQTGCEVSCQSCETCVSCQMSEYCPFGYYTCQGCETCQPCYSCQTACELACQDCQTGCEVSCQTGCEVSCQEGCQVVCQGCMTCYICYSWYT
jgi:hypothetical protein